MNKIYQNLGIIKKAGMCVIGEAILSHIRNKTVYLVIVASDASIKTKKMYQDKCHFYQVPCVIYGSKADLSKAVKKDNIAAVAIDNQGFAKKVYSQLKEVVS